MTEAPAIPETETDAPPRRVAKKRGVVDAMIAKDRVAVFWFLFACATAAGCAWFIVVLSETVKHRAPFVIMDGAGVFYSAPGVNFADAEAMHLALTEMLVDAMFDRAPDGLRKEARLIRLCTRTGLQEIRAEIDREDDFFRRQNVVQTYEIDSVKFLGAAGQFAGTEARGRLFRRGDFGGEIEEVSQFEVKFRWIMNPDIAVTGAFPGRAFDLFKYERTPLINP